MDVYENDYRAAFKRFLQSEHNVPPESIAPDLNADHILNKEFAKRHGLHYVRLAFVPKEYNQGWGGTVERLLTHALARDNSIYRIDYFIFMKVLNIIPPANEADYLARRKALAQRLSAETGLNTTMLLEGMDGIFKHWDVL